MKRRMVLAGMALLGLVVLAYAAEPERHVKEARRVAGDLVVKSVTLTPNVPANGQVKVTIVLKNAGGNITKPFRTSLYMLYFANVAPPEATNYTMMRPAEKRVDTQETASLAAGAETSIETTYASAGKCMLMVMADAPFDTVHDPLQSNASTQQAVGTITELSELNNAFAVPFDGTTQTQNYANPAVQ